MAVVHHQVTIEARNVIVRSIQYFKAKKKYYLQCDGKKDSKFLMLLREAQATVTIERSENPAGNTTTNNPSDWNSDDDDYHKVSDMKKNKKSHNSEEYLKDKMEHAKLPMMLAIYQFKEKRQELDGMVDNIKQTEKERQIKIQSKIYEVYSRIHKLEDKLDAIIQMLESEEDTKPEQESKQKVQKD